MSEHVATIEWRRDGQTFSDNQYARAHDWRFDGGQRVRGSSSPAVVRTPMSDPFGVDPEEALVASTSSCHMLWFLDLARRAGLDVASYRDSAEGEMGKGPSGAMMITRITLRPEIAFAGRQPSEVELADLHHHAHEACFIANSLRADIFVEPIAPLVDAR